MALLVSTLTWLACPTEAFSVIPRIFCFLDPLTSGVDPLLSQSNSLVDHDYGNYDLDMGLPASVASSSTLSVDPEAPAGD